MKANYHTHTWRCNHAKPDERAYVENAIKGGLKILGFSDHAPYIFPGGYQSGFRMLPELAQNYADTVLALKKEYKEDIEILLAFETEYYPDYFDTYLEFISQFPYDYLLLGQHFLGSEIGMPYAGAHTGKSWILTTYADQCIEAMKTGRFLYLAHPDLINFSGDNALYKREMTRLCRAAKELSMPLEFNLLGFDEHRNYPNRLFWELAGKEGNTVVLGSDAHRADFVYRKSLVEEAKKYLAQFGITPVSELKL